MKFKIFILLIFIIVASIGSFQLYQHRNYDVSVVAGPGVTHVTNLSNYHNDLRKTIGDTKVYFMEGKEKGGKALVIANTHANEIAAGLSALTFIENAVVEKGTLIVIPYFNNSASRNTKPGDAYPLYYSIPTDWGKKKFRMGNRNAAPLDQWPDPDVYIHYPDKQSLSYMDIRNTNRTWPGRPDGVLAEKITYAAMELMRQENIDIVFDLHGAETMFPVTNCIVAPDVSMRIATMASLTVKATEGFDNHVEPSPVGFRGLSHREIGDFSDTMPFLLEAPIPFLDQPTGPKTKELLLNGKDPFLLELSKKNLLFVPYDEKGWPVDKRVGQHNSVILEVINQLGKRFSEKEIEINGVPDYSKLLKNGVGHYFHDPKKVDNKNLYFQ